MSTELYRVRFRRPDGTEAWLGDAGSGSTDDPDESPQLTRRAAERIAEARNDLYGWSGRRYWLVKIAKEATT